MTAFAVALGVGWGVDALAESWTKRSVLPIVVGAGLLALALGLGAIGTSDLPDRWTVMSWLAVAAIVVAALLVALRADGSAVTAMLVVAVIAFELAALARYSVIDETTTSTAFDDRSPGVGAELRDRPGLTIAFTNDEFADIGYLVAGFRPNTNALAEVRSLDGYDGGVQVTDRFVALETSQRHGRRPDPATAQPPAAVVATGGRGGGRRAVGPHRSDPRRGDATARVAPHRLGRRRLRSVGEPGLGGRRRGTSGGRHRGRARARSAIADISSRCT